MKKIILLLITLITIVNVSYASFPVLENIQQDIVKYSEITTFSDPEDGIYSFLGFVVGFLSILGYFLPLLLLFSPNKAFRRGIYVGLLTMVILIVGILTWFIASGGELTIM
ncbi:MAG: hypothetical protein HN564_09000 [Flavobacteriales bacterium]|jgi:hypothetical protein|nr:hypothetical protein [Flavobacteriales bacterium]|tara:strand:+ start:1869 stop:2201 length:333 start_codon:yes stop_codon:yes gene_type:complete